MGFGIEGSDLGFLVSGPGCKVWILDFFGLLLLIFDFRFLGFQVLGFEFWVLDLGFEGLGFGVWGLGFGIRVSGIEIWNLGFWSEG